MARQIKQVYALSPALYNSLPYIWFCSGLLALYLIGMTAIFSSLVFALAGTLVLNLRSRNTTMMFMLALYILGVLTAKAAHWL